MDDASIPSPHPIASVMQGAEYRPGPFWAARVASILATIGLLWAFQTFIVPKLGIYDIRLLVLSLLFATLAVSLNLINGITGQFSIGHAAFYLIGAITAGKLSVAFFNPQNYNPIVWLILMVIAGGAAAALAGLLVGLPSLRLRGDYLAVATLGFGEIVNVFLRNQDGRDQAITLTAVVAVIAAFIVLWAYMKLAALVPPQKGAAGIVLAIVKFVVALVAMRYAAAAIFVWLGPSLDKFGRLDTGGATGLVGVPKLTQIYFIILLFIGAIAVSRNLLKSVHGLSFLAVREDEIAADATGVSATNIKVTAFALGAAIAGMAGALFAHYNGSVSPDDFKMDVSFMLVAMVVIGGTGSITGAALAGIALKLLEEGLRKLQPISAIDLLSLILAAMLVYLIYKDITEGGWLSSKMRWFSRKMRWVSERIGRMLGTKVVSLLHWGFTRFFAFLGFIACGGLLYLCYLIFKGDLSWVLKVGAIALIVGAIIGMLFTAARRIALPRFGMFAFCLGLVIYTGPLLAMGLHAIPAIEKLIGGTTYNPSDLRWAVFSIALVFVMILRSQGLLGHHEFSWSFVKANFGKRELTHA